MFAAFDAEEMGLLGASNYAEHPSFSLERTAAVLNFDMVGRLGRGRLFVTDAETSAELGKSVRDLAKSIGVPVETRVGGNYRGDRRFSSGGKSRRFSSSLACTRITTR